MNRITDLAFWRGILDETIRWAIHALPRVAVVLALSLVVFAVFGVICRRLERVLVERARKHGDASEGATREAEKRVETLITITRKAGKLVIWTLLVLLVLVQVGVNVAPLIAGAGIVGLAIGFGAQELVRDVISGFFMLVENQVRQGDIAEINGTGGLVESVGLRTMKLRDLSGTVHVFQNGKINTLANKTSEWSAMVFDVGVAYKEDIDQVISVMRDVANQQADDAEYRDRILSPIEIFGLDSFGDNALVIKARIKTSPGEQWAVGRDYRQRLKIAFDQRNIEIPFPHRTLYWGEASPPFRVSSSLDRNDGKAQPPQSQSHTGVS